MNSEIEALKSALAISPANLELKKILHQKMVSDGHNYKDELFSLSKDILKEEPDHIPSIECLFSHYFRNEKYSICELILENHDDYDAFSSDFLILISKMFVELKQIDRASEVYRFTIEKYPNAKDKELDTLFRAPATKHRESAKRPEFMQKPKESFKDVGGMDNVKREINLKIIQPLKNKSLFQRYGKKIGGGILLYGPPGCGKTFIARATAGQIDAQFLSIGINDILSMWMGDSERNLHEYFSLARNNKPIVVFMDEIDALGMKRAQFSSSSGRNIVNQLLSEMDGIDADNDGVLIIGATNSPWDLDSAFKRPGRFDRIIFVPPPDHESREIIIKLKLQNKPTEDIDYSLIAAKTKGFSGADIDAVIDIAIENKIEQALDTGKTHKISTNDLVKAAIHRTPSTKEWFNTVKSYTIFSNKSGLYDDVIKYMKKNKY